MYGEKIGLRGVRVARAGSAVRLILRLAAPAAWAPTAAGDVAA